MERMALLPAIEKRRAYRAIGAQPVNDEILTRMVAAAHTAPSSANNQPWRMVTVTDEHQLALLKETLSKGNYWAKQAPVLTAFVTHPDWSMRVGGRDLAFFELGMAAMAYQLQAVSEGLHVHPIVGFDAPKAKAVLGIDDDVVLEIMMVVGYPGDSSLLNEKHRQIEESDRMRKDLAEVSSFSRWDKRLDPRT